MHLPVQPRVIATMWEESKKVGEGQQEGGIETKGIKSGGGWFGVRVVLIVTFVEIVMRGEVIEYNTSFLTTRETSWHLPL